MWASIADRNGVAKERPVIVLTRSAEIRKNTLLQVMAVSTTFPEPVPGHCVELPHDPSGRVSTGLRSRCVAVVPWLARITPAEITRYGGDVPPTLMIEILEKLNLLR